MSIYMMVICKFGTDTSRKFLTMMEKKGCGTLYLLEMAEMRKLIIVKMYLLHVWK